jgi:hypothetical protein
VDFPAIIQHHNLRILRGKQVRNAAALVPGAHCKFSANRSFDGAEIQKLIILDVVGQRIVTGPFVQGAVAAGYKDNEARPVRATT